MGEKEVELGNKVKDSITGTTGKVTGVWRSISSKPRMMVEGIDTTGRPFEYWIDMERLEITD